MNAPRNAWPRPRAAPTQPSRPSSLFRRIVAALVAVFAANSLACASFDKSEIYAAYGADGEVVYYRITLRGYGSLGKVHYRSGWFSARAVDELFGDVTSQGDMRVSVLRQRQRAIEAATKAYADAVDAQKNDERDAAKARMDRIEADFEPLLDDPDEALEPDQIPTTAPADLTRAEAFDYSGKKFVMVLANDPDEILKMIGDSIQKDRLVDAVASFARGKAEQSAATNTAALEQATIAAEQLAGRLKAVRDGLGETPTAADLRTRLQYLRTLTTP